MSEKTTQRFIDAYAVSHANLPGADGWLAPRRAAALAAFAEAGVPHRRLEDWKYTDLRRALEKVDIAAAPVHQGAVVLPERPSSSAFAGIDTHKIVFVNGRFHAGLSDTVKWPKGVERHSLADVTHEQWAKGLIERRFGQTKQAEDIVDLNTALMADGIALRIRKGVSLDKPLHLVFVNADDGASHTRNLVLLEDEASATIFESHIGNAASFADIVTDVALGQGAKLRHLKLLDDAAEAIHLATLRTTLAARAHLEHFALTMGTGLSRSQSFVAFTGEGAYAGIDGAYALRGTQHADHFCVTDHAVPNCTSHTLFKGVLDGASEGVFQGKVLVRRGAQKTDGRQMTQALLLSRDASMNAKPELEIYADDVQCAHGSTVGELSHDAIFYLRARGIPEKEARRLLVLAFLDDALDRVPHDEARTAMRDLVSHWFGEAA